MEEWSSYWSSLWKLLVKLQLGQIFNRGVPRLTFVCLAVSPAKTQYPPRRSWKGDLASCTGNWVNGRVFGDLSSLCACLPGCATIWRARSPPDWRRLPGLDVSCGPCQGTLQKSSADPPKNPPIPRVFWCGGWYAAVMCGGCFCLFSLAREWLSSSLIFYRSSKIYGVRWLSQRRNKDKIVHFAGRLLKLAHKIQAFIITVYIALLYNWYKKAIKHRYIAHLCVPTAPTTLAGCPALCFPSPIHERLYEQHLSIWESSTEITAPAPAVPCCQACGLTGGLQSAYRATKPEELTGAGKKKTKQHDRVAE